MLKHGLALAILIAGAGAARAVDAELPFTHNSPPLDHASVVGGNLDIHTLITPTPAGFKVHVTFSNGSRRFKDMCSRTWFRDSNHRLLGTSIASRGLWSAPGGKTERKWQEENVLMNRPFRDMVAFVEIEQLIIGADCQAQAKTE